MKESVFSSHLSSNHLNPAKILRSDKIRHSQEGMDVDDIKIFNQKVVCEIHLHKLILFIMMTNELKWDKAESREMSWDALVTEEAVMV